jgi:hypothetical protein
MMDDDDCAAIGAISGKEKSSTWEKPASVPLCPPKIPHDLIWARTRAAAEGNRRLSTLATAQPLSLTWFNIQVITSQNIKGVLA